MRNDEHRIPVCRNPACMTCAMRAAIQAVAATRKVEEHEIDVTEVMFAAAQFSAEVSGLKEAEAKKARQKGRNLHRLMMIGKGEPGHGKPTYRQSATKH